MSIDLNPIPDREITTKRKFDFPRSSVFNAFKEPNYLKNWWGPDGFTNTFHVFDFRVGGRWTFTMHGPEKGNYPNDCFFVEIEEPSLIVWDRLSQPHFMVIVELQDISNKVTQLTFRQRFNSREECEKIRKFVIDKNEENMDRLQSVLLKM